MTEVLAPLNSGKETQHIINCQMTKNFGILTCSSFVIKKEIILSETAPDCILLDLNLKENLVFRSRKELS